MDLRKKYKYRTLKEIRTILRMTQENLSIKVSKSKSTICGIEARETKGSASIKTLREISSQIRFSLKYKYLDQSLLINQHAEDFNSLKQVRIYRNISLSDLSQQLNKSISTLSEFETRELSGNVLVKNLNDVANHMNFKLSLEYIPDCPLDKMLLNQAIKHIKKQYKYLEEYSYDDIFDEAVKHISKKRTIDW